MAHRRSGAQRRAYQKAQERQAQQQQQEQQEAGASGSEASGHHVAAVAAKQPAMASALRGNKQQALQPEVQEIVAAVASLYCDELKPFGRLLRKRLAERHQALTEAVAEGPDLSAKRLPEVDVRYLHDVCADCEQLCMQPEEGGDWSVTLVGCEPRFVDFQSLVDTYPCEMWKSAEEYFAKDEDMTLPGGRYHCAQALLSRGLAFLDGCTLGQVCHIVQLSMSVKKLLGYQNGAVVPYGRSQSMVKETCAVQQQARGDACQEAASLPLANLETARACLQTILQEAAAASGEGVGPGIVPLSNVKRQFRAEFQLELSETMLGHSKLSTLLQDPCFSDICSVQLEGHGYMVVQKTDEATKPCKQLFCEDEPLCFEDDIGELASFPNFGPTPGPFAPTPSPSAHPFTCLPYVDSFLAGINEESKASKAVFCVDEPLCIENADDTLEVPDFGVTPGPFAPTPMPRLCRSPCPPGLEEYSAGVDERRGCKLEFCANEPLCLDDAEPVDVPNFGRTPGPFSPSPCPLTSSFPQAPLHASNYNPLPPLCADFYGLGAQNGILADEFPPLACLWPQSALATMHQNMYAQAISTSGLDPFCSSLSIAEPSDSNTTGSGESSCGEESIVSSRQVSPRDEQGCGNGGVSKQAAWRLKLGGCEEAVGVPTLRLSDYVLS